MLINNHKANIEVKAYNAQLQKTEYKDFKGTKKLFTLQQFFKNLNIEKQEKKIVLMHLGIKKK